MRAVHDIAATLVPPRFDSGTRVIRIDAGRHKARLAEALLGRARETGLAALRPGRLAPWRAPPDLVHRHVILLIEDGRDRRALGDWLAALLRATPRGHVVIDLASRRRARKDRGSGAAWANVGTSMTRGRIVEAEARLTAAVALARIAEHVAPWPVRRDLARIRLEQGRLEEARALLAPRGPAREHRALAGALARAQDGSAPHRNLGEVTMYLLRALPTLLTLVTEVEDEPAALTAICRWARRECLADVACVLAAGDGRVLASDGRDGLTDDARRRMAAAEQRCELPRADGVIVGVPVRHGGARVATIVIGGPPERRETMGEAASAVAAVSASLVHARLTTIAIGRHGEGLAGEILGRSPSIVAVRDAVARAAAAPFPVLIEGESGTGKELVARAVHRLSARRDRRLATLNCAALSDELVEAELFGHVRGAFTGAVAPRAGLFEDASGGVLFLDEVGELSPRAQAKLLRALQDGEIRRVGENAARRVDVRVIAATNRALAEMTAAGGFREDLLFRLAVIRLRVPPLRDRTEDIPLLAQVFWRRLSAEAGKRAVLGADAIARLVCYPWPGNVRELQNVVAALVVQAPVRGRVRARHVDQVLAAAGGRALEAPVSLEWARTQCERRTIAAALARHGGRRAAAARELGLTRQGLAKAVRRLHVHTRESVEGVA